MPDSGVAAITAPPPAKDAGTPPVLGDTACPSGEKEPAEFTCATASKGACATGWTACRYGKRVCETPPPMPEVADGIDNDCNGVVDDVAQVRTHPRALVAVPRYAWTDAAFDIDTMVSALDQAGIAYDKQKKGTDWDTVMPKLGEYALVIVPGYVEGGIVRPEIKKAFEDFVSAGGVLVLMKPIPDEEGTAGALELAGIRAATHESNVTSLRFDGDRVPALAAIDSPEERDLPINDDPPPEPVDVWTYEPDPAEHTQVLGRAMHGTKLLGAVATRRPLGKGAVYSWGHDLASYIAEPCYVNCFEPSGDMLRLFVRDALREAVHGHIVLKATVPGGADSAVLLTHDIDAPDAYNAGEWGEPGAIQMAKLEKSLGALGTYNMTTDYIAGYFKPETVKELCDVGMCPLGDHSVRHSQDFNRMPRGSCGETQSGYGPKSTPTVCGEVKVPLDIVQKLTGARPRIWRSPYLMIPKDLFDVLSDMGIEYDSSMAVGDLKYNLPLDLSVTGVQQFVYHRKHIVEFPIACEDGSGGITDGVWTRVELQESSRAIYRRQWRTTMLRNAANQSITTVLVHPSRGRDMPWENLAVKIEEVKNLALEAKSHGISFESISHLGPYWRARQEVMLDATFQTGSGYVGTFRTGLLPIKDFTLEFGDKIDHFECPTCGPFEVKGKRVVFTSTLAKSSAFSFTATAVAKR
ncbi:MAG TPA: polysaccharide deacetylase family protein [Polyangiaceae bacterium]